MSTIFKSNVKGNLVSKKCKECVISFFSYPSIIKKRKFCSKKCFSNYQSKHLLGKNNPMYGVRGKKASNWRGGVSNKNDLIRHSAKYKSWRTKVFKRDRYTCVQCKKGGKYIQADHIKPFAYFPKLRFNIDNGRTLCMDCHSKTDTYKGRARINYGKK
jgi:5-methylcytosine-specific restriction endonuclease McrA